ncbi:MAG: DUF4365 domain-containing protein [Candidatus Electrothrix sp. AX5]|nr:DUF4365 domain-containing protein [Candidatus Electrothrix sp. AX5]
MEIKIARGQFLAVQIKATTDDQKKILYLSARHFKYWESIDCPVLIALVNLRREKVYLKHIETNNKEESSVGDFESHKFEFNLEEDRLTKKISPKLRLLGYASDVHKIKTALLVIFNECKEILKQTSSEDEEIIEDSDHYLGLMRNFRGLEAKLHECKVLVQPINKFVGDCGYGDVLNKFMKARHSLICFLHDWDFDCHDGEALVPLGSDVKSS